MKQVINPTAFVLLLANLVPLIGVLVWDWSVINVLLIFWAENLIIGAFNLAKMFLAGLRHRQTIPLRGTLFLMMFFAVHYGMFTLVHGVALRAIFLDGPGVPLFESVQANFQLMEQAGLWWACAALVISHGFSFFSNFVRLNGEAPLSTRALMMAPYSRVMVLHACVVLGAFLVELLETPVAGLVVLIVMKIGMDIRAHNRQRTRESMSNATI